MRAPLLLLVDDDPRMLRDVGEAVRAAGAQTITAGDGVEGLERARATTFDLVVTDVHMPRMEAYTFVPALRRLRGYADTPVIVLTSDADRATKLALLEAGADDFVLKPFDAAELVARVRANLRKGALAFSLTQVTAERDSALERLAQRNAELERLTTGLIVALERANEFNDSDTGNHIRRVCCYSELLARAHGCDAEFADQLRRYAGLHDVGKVGIRDAVLKKPGKLTPEEFDEMKTHTLIGYDLLESAGLPRMAANIAVGHHERWDGGGYPRGLRADAIPLEARIVTVADVFDALVSKRCYKPAFDFETARRMMRESAGAQFDPVLVERFFDQEDAIFAIMAEYSEVEPVAAAWG
jgi:putative two-component system response regulator